MRFRSATTFIARLSFLLALLLAPFLVSARAQSPSPKFTIADTGLALGPLNGVAFGNGTFVVSTASAGLLRVFTSPDAVTWNETTVRFGNATAVNSPVRFVNGKFLIQDVTVVSNVVTANFRTSTDGLVWTSATAGASPTQIIAEAAGDGARIIAGGTNNYLVTSVNGGATWTNVPLNPGFGNWHSIAYGGGRWFLAGSFTSGFTTVRRLYTSTDGVTFTAVPDVSDPLSLAYGGGRWLVAGANATIGYVGPGGTAFTPTTYPTGSAVFDLAVNSLRYANARFISLRPAPSSYESGDATTWLPFAPAPPSGVELTAPLDLAYGNDKYVLLTAPGRGSSSSLLLVADTSVASASGRLINLSVLTDLATAGDTFTLGYVVGGAGTTGGKPVVLRAAGPSLGALGVSDTLTDPKIDLFAGSTPAGGNDNWGGGATLTAALANVGAFAYTGPASLDAAVATTLTTRDNSVAVSSVNRGTGKVIAEIYDATPAANFVTTTPRLLNVSVRKHLGSGLTAGFVLGGAAPTKILIRAVGPGLAAFGVPDTVVDPQLTLFNSAAAKIGENNDWAGTTALTAAFTSVGAFALPSATSKDAALLATLSPGNYTVVVTGTATTTGVALVEVYEVP